MMLNHARTVICRAWSIVTQKNDCARPANHISFLGCWHYQPQGPWTPETFHSQAHQLSTLENNISIVHHQPVHLRTSSLYHSNFWGRFNRDTVRDTLQLPQSPISPTKTPCQSRQSLTSLTAQTTAFVEMLVRNRMSIFWL